MQCTRRTLDVAQRALADKKRLEQELLDVRQRLHSQEVIGPGLTELKGIPAQRAVTVTVVVPM